MSKERLLSTLALIRSGIEIGAKEWNLRALREDDDEEERQDSELASSLMEDVYDLSSSLSKGTLSSPLLSNSVTEKFTNLFRYRFCCCRFSDILYSIETWNWVSSLGRRWNRRYRTRSKFATFREFFLRLLLGNRLRLTVITM